MLRAPGTVEEPAAASSVGPKHSQSIGELASILPASDHLSRRGTTPDREPVENQEHAKHFWKRKQDLTKPVEKSYKSKPVTEKATPPPSISRDSTGVKRHRSASPAVEGSPCASPKKKHKKIPQAQQPKPESQKKQEAQKKQDAQREHKKVEAQRKLETQKKEDAEKKQEEHTKVEAQKKLEAQKKSGSPKWFHFPGKQQRSRSESPDRQKTGEGHPEPKGEHPLEVTASRASGGAEGAGDIPSAEEPQMNVLDRIKHYNIKDADVQRRAVGGGGAGKGKDMHAGDTARGEKGKKGGEASVEKDRGKKEKGKADGKAKDRAGDKKKSDKKMTGSAKKEDISSKKESETPTKHWNPFKKSQKNVDKTKDSVKKSKKAKEAKKEAPAVDESAQMFAGVKNRIEMLKELGLETDGTDGGDAVLLSVVQIPPEEELEHLDGEGEDEEEDGGTGEEEELGESDEGEGEEVDYGGPEVRVPSPSSPDEVSINDNVMDKVKKLQEMHNSRAMENRPRCFTDAKRYEL